MHAIEPTTRWPLRSDATGHYFARDDGSPFFYLADTVWMLFCRLTEDEVRELFADRASKGFTVIQAVVFRDLFEPNTANVDGIRPFASEQEMQAVRLNPEWIDWVVHITRIASEYGLVLGILPTWGDKWNEHSNSAGPVIMDMAKARDYCRQLSDGLAACDNVIWILGGDSPVQKPEHAATIRAMALGIREGGSGQRLMTFHPSGMGSSALFHGDAWLDFNSLQTSHYKPNIPGYLHIERLFAEPPAKPCLDMEPNYELSPMFEVGRGPAGQPYVPVFTPYDVRKSFYRTVLAGAAGFTYGCEPIRQIIKSGDRVHIWEDVDLPDWREALDAAWICAALSAPSHPFRAVVLHSRARSGAPRSTEASRCLARSDVHRDSGRRSAERRSGLICLRRALYRRVLGHGVRSGPPVGGDLDWDTCRG